MRVQEIDSEVDLETLLGDIRGAATSDLATAEEVLDPFIRAAEAGERDVESRAERAALDVLTTIDSWRCRSLHMQSWTSTRRANPATLAQRFGVERAGFSDGLLE
jgi:hypothetical protein